MELRDPTLSRYKQSLTKSNLIYLSMTLFNFCHLSVAFCPACYNTELSSGWLLKKKLPEMIPMMTYVTYVNRDWLSLQKGILTVSAFLSLCSLFYKVACGLQPHLPKSAVYSKPTFCKVFSLPVLVSPFAVCPKPDFVDNARHQSVNK